MSQPSVARHHADWLSLVEVSGPFVSLPVLLRIFPQGLEPRDPAQAKALRAAYEEWQDNPAAPGGQRAWVMHVLTAVLGYTPGQIAEGQTLPAGLEAKMPEMGETLRPDFALVGIVGGDVAGQTQLLIAGYPAEQALDKPVIGRHWKATPPTRMMELLHGTGVPLGLVTNGEHWMLVNAPRGETTGYVSWYGALWLDEPITLRAFHSLLGVRRFFGVAADSTLMALLKESANDQQEVTDQLGYQVREAVEVLVKSVDTLDRENHRKLLKDLPQTALYDAALTIMMRLVFLFAAEERGLLHLGKPLYDDNYAVSTLQAQLQEIADQHGEEVLERRFDAWTRLLATFRAVHGGIQHQDLLMLAYGGSLFDPDRYPFLEGRPPQSSWRTSAAEPLAVNNRVVLHLLNSLQRLQVRLPGGGPAESRRISFRALGVEQIGHVYEGLLDRTAVRASEPVIGIKGARHKERDFSLAPLELLFLQGKEKLLEFLKEETGRSLSALRHAMDEVNLQDEHRLLIACGHDKKLRERIRPFVNLIREDSFGRPLVTLTDSIYVTTATTRRSTGTHYTPPSLTEPIVQHTLEPLVYEGPAEGVAREQWKLKSPSALLDVKVCDMAMGSGAFLVQTCRYISERLVEAWENLEQRHPGEVLITPEGAFSTGSPSERLVPADANERIAIARRVVADRCLYGVDINPMAVEMAKLSLWLITLQRDKPFNFLDHALKCGDSLLGVRSVNEIENFSLRSGERQVTFATANLSLYVEEASVKRRTLEGLPSYDQTQIETKNRLYAEAEAATAKVKALADCLIALEMRGLDGEAYDKKRDSVAYLAEMAMRKPLQDFQAYAREQLIGRRTFHWPVEFPEVASSGGFDAFVGNPPFLGGARISGTYGDSYLSYLLATNPKSIGNADLSSYFLRRCVRFLRPRGVAGIIATNSIAKGETRESGLQYLIDTGVSFYRAIKSQPWPGAANVFVSVVHLYIGDWGGDVVLDEKRVGGISSFLDSHEAEFKPFRLQYNLGVVFRGPTIGGEGFILTETEALGILAQEPKCREIIKPFLTGQDINQHYQQSSDRFVIDFGAMEEDEASSYKLCWERLYATVRLQRKGNKIKQREIYWWRFIGRQEKLYEAIDGLETVLACGEVSKYWGVSWINAKQVFAGKVVVFALSGNAHFSFLNSCFHTEWAEKTSSRLKGDPAYSLAETFETLPFPRPLLAVRLGKSISPEEESNVAKMTRAGTIYHQHRQTLMKDRSVGLTTLYNQFHDRKETSDEICRFRTLHVELDQAVATAYGWTDLNLDHGFHDKGFRYTVSEPARRNILDRLLALNHQRHAEEQSEGTAWAVSSSVRHGRKKRDTADKLTLDLL